MGTTCGDRSRPVVARYPTRADISRPRQTRSSSRMTRPACHGRGPASELPLVQADERALTQRAAFDRAVNVIDGGLVRQFDRPGQTVHGDDVVVGPMARRWRWAAPAGFAERVRP